MKKFGVSFCFLVIVSIFAIFGCSFNNEKVFADTLEGAGTSDNPYLISDVADFNYMANKINNGDADFVAAYYKLTDDLIFTNESGANLFLYGIGTEDNNFKGVFDGGGNSIKNVKLNVIGNASASYGIFNNIQNATIKNLSVEIDFIYTGAAEDSSQINLGGIVGKSSGNSEIFNCKTLTKLYSYDEVNNEKSNAQVYSSLNFGGIIGSSEGTSIHDCYSLVEFACEQFGDSLVESYYGGIAGKVNGGEIYNVYVAPTESTIASLTGVVAEKENMFLKNNSYAVVYFGGIAGSVSGRNFTMFNTLFIGYLKVENSVKYGGLIGKMHASAASRPDSSNITQSKYLTINNANTVSFNYAIANADDVAFVAHSTLTQMTSMPNNYSYFEDSSNGWNDLKYWDFEEVWKTSTIFNGSGIFLPDLQQFSDLSFYLDYQNYSTYYTLNFVGENPDVTSKKFKIGDTVEIEGRFNASSAINYADFYEFENWKKVGNEEFSADGKIKLTLVCSNQTAGSYYLTMKGKLVSVNVNIVNENIEGGNYGSVKYGDHTYLENFSFNARYADDTTVLKLEAIDTLDTYKFSHFASGENFNAQNRIVSFKLNNNRPNLPLVEVVDGNLVCNINVVFSNNTSSLSIKLPNGGGTFKIDDGDFLTGNSEKTLVNGKTYTLIATPSEGYVFDGWYLNGEKVESESTYNLIINQNTNLEIKFIKSDENAGGVNIWLIIGPIIGALALGGIITLIVLKVKKNGANSYKKNYRY